MIYTDDGRPLMLCDLEEAQAGTNRQIWIEAKILPANVLVVEMALHMYVPNTRASQGPWPEQISIHNLYSVDIGKPPESLSIQQQHIMKCFSRQQKSQCLTDSSPKLGESQKKLHQIWSQEIENGFARKTGIIGLGRVAHDPKADLLLVHRVQNGKVYGIYVVPDWSQPTILPLVHA